MAFGITLVEQFTMTASASMFYMQLGIRIKQI